MSLAPQNFQSYLRSLRVLFLALILGQALVLVVFYVVRLDDLMVPPPERKRLVLQLMMAALAALLALSYFLHRNKLASARTQPSLPEKLTVYRTALILRWAPMEAATLLSGVFYWVSGLTFPYYLAGLLLVFFGMQWPNRLDIFNNLHLSNAEQMLLDDPNELVAEISGRPGV